MSGREELVEAILATMRCYSPKGLRSEFGDDLADKFEKYLETTVPPDLKAKVAAAKKRRDDATVEYRTISGCLPKHMRDNNGF